MVATHAMCLNKEVIQQVSKIQITFEHCCLVKGCCNASCKEKNYQHEPDFHRGRIFVYRDCS